MQYSPIAVLLLTLFQHRALRKRVKIEEVLLDFVLFENICISLDYNFEVNARTFEYIKGKDKDKVNNLRCRLKELLKITKYFSWQVLYHYWSILRQKTMLISYIHT